MLSKGLVKRLNDQINLEFYSSNLYLQMSSWCEYKGLSGCAAFLQAHSTEEMGHMQRLFTYVNETGAMAELGEIKAAPMEYKSIVDVFKTTYEHECHVTLKINELAEAAMNDKDFSTFNFLQWYVAEQHEEEKLFKSILDRIEIIGTEGKGLFLIDQEIARMGRKAASAPRG